MTNHPVDSEREQYLMREVRMYLGIAYEAERAGQVELADALGAVSANKLAVALRIGERHAMAA